MTQTPNTVTAAPVIESQRGISPLALLGRFGALIFLIILIIVFASSNPGFLSSRNLLNIMRQVSITGLISIGMTFVILTGGIDLSVGSLLAVAGIAAAFYYKGGAGGGFEQSANHAEGASVLVAFLIACVVGLVGGLAQGGLITLLKVAPFVVTLGGMSVFRGATLLISKGGPISNFDEAFSWWGQGQILRPEMQRWFGSEVGIPVPALIFLGVALIAYIILRYTQYGRYIYAVGGNTEAARLSGLNTNLLITSVYVIIGLLCGVGGFVLAARLNSAEAIAGTGYELTVIASVVIGGTSLSGGEGGIFGTVMGALLIGVLTNGLSINNVNPYLQQVIIGLIIVFAVFFDKLTRSRRR